MGLLLPAPLGEAAGPKPGGPASMRWEQPLLYEPGSSRPLFRGSLTPSEWGFCIPRLRCPLPCEEGWASREGRGIHVQSDFLALFPKSVAVLPQALLEGVCKLGDLVDFQPRPAPESQARW